MEAEGTAGGAVARHGLDHQVAVPGADTGPGCWDERIELTRHGDDRPRADVNRYAVQRGVGGHLAATAEDRAAPEVDPLAGRQVERADASPLVDHGRHQ